MKLKNNILVLIVVAFFLMAAGVVYTIGGNNTTTGIKGAVRVDSGYVMPILNPVHFRKSFWGPDTTAMLFTDSASHALMYMRDGQWDSITGGGGGDFLNNSFTAVSGPQAQDFNNVAQVWENVGIFSIRDTNFHTALAVNSPVQTTQVGWGSTFTLYDNTLNTINEVGRVVHRSGVYEKVITLEGKTTLDDSYNYILALPTIAANDTVILPSASTYYDAVTKDGVRYFIKNTSNIMSFFIKPQAGQLIDGVAIYTLTPFPSSGDHCILITDGTTWRKW